MELELDIFTKEELIRACELVGYSNKNNKLDEYDELNLKIKLLQKANPDNIDLREQYIKALELYKIKYNGDDSDDLLKHRLYEYNCRLLEKALSKMSKRKKIKLAKTLEKSLEVTSLELLKKVGKKGTAIGGTILALQGGAIVVTGSNLGICMLLTTGLSGVSGILGVTFPFAAYTGVAILGGKIIAVGSFLTNPAVAIPLIGLSLYLIYRNKQNKQYISLAGINYLIEAKKRLGI